MWTPKPRGKVMRRPKPLGRQHCRKAAAAKAAAPGVQLKGDPHRDVRYFGVKHTDITRIYFTDSSTSRDQSPYPPGRFEKKQTDITAYLEKVVPSHPAAQPPAVGQAKGPLPQRSDAGDARTSHPSRPPAADDNPPSRTLKRDSAPAQHHGEKVRPITAATGEMKRLSAGNSHPPAPLTSSTAGSKRTLSSKHGSRPGTRKSKLASVQGSCRVITGTSHSSAARLQSVPE